MDKDETAEEKLERAKQMRLEADEAWARGSKEHSTYLHGAAAQLKKDAEVEIAARSSSTLRIRRPDGVEVVVVGELLQHDPELQEALDAWRGLTEEQREQAIAHKFTHVSFLNRDAVEIALRLLKATAR